MSIKRIKKMKYCTECDKYSECLKEKPAGGEFHFSKVHEDLPRNDGTRNSMSDVWPCLKTCRSAGGCEGTCRKADEKRRELEAKFPQAVIEFKENVVEARCADPIGAKMTTKQYFFKVVLPKKKTK